MYFCLQMRNSPLFTLIYKDLLSEWRQQHTFFGVLLYVGSTVFMVYMMNGQPEAKVWNALFWITQLFIAVNSVAKSFLQEHPNRFRYYYTLVKPSHFLVAKMIYSTILMLLVSGLSLLLFNLMLGAAIKQLAVFMSVTAVGSISLSVTFTFLSALAARAQNNASLMAILGMPLMIPILMILSKLAVKAIVPIYQEGWSNLLLILGGLDILIIILGIILFPFLWQE